MSDFNLVLSEQHCKDGDMECAHKVSLGDLNKLLDEKTEKMVGEVLTILEAVIPGDRQTDATKATVKKILWGFNRDVKSGCEGIMTSEEE